MEGTFFFLSLFLPYDFWHHNDCSLNITTTMSIALGDIELSVVGFVEICYPGLIHGYCFFFFFFGYFGDCLLWSNGNSVKHFLKYQRMWKELANNLVRTSQREGNDRSTYGMSFLIFLFKFFLLNSIFKTSFGFILELAICLSIYLFLYLFLLLFKC